MLSQGNSTLKYTLKSWQVTYKAPTLFGPFPCTEITNKENSLDFFMQSSTREQFSQEQSWLHLEY
jgi:hypothetical protein